jgi:hypothetical protein
MYQFLTDEQNTRKVFLLHCILALGVLASSWVLILWFYFVLLGGIPDLFNGQKRDIGILFLASYLTPFEVLSRIANTSPALPYELGKYLLFVLLFYGIISSRYKGRSAGWLMLVLLLPAVFIDESGSISGYKPIVFNVLGPVNVALGVIYSGMLRIDNQLFIRLLKLSLWPMFCVLLYVFIRTPEFDEIEFNLGANFDTAGGFGSNQVATVLGAGLFFTFLFWYLKKSVSSYRIIDTVLLLGFAVQGFLTFSRGGMIGGLVAIIILILFLSKDQLNPEKKNGVSPKFAKLLLPVLVLLISFSLADNLTGGLLTLRYQGESGGTLSGTKEKNLNTLTTGRFSIFQSDIDLWERYPLLGTGVGASSFLREGENRQIAHVEMSRLLAEHGVLGLGYMLVFAAITASHIRDFRKDNIKLIQTAILFLALFTTFHAATRTFISPLFVIFGFINVRITSALTIE